MPGPVACIKTATPGWMSVRNPRAISAREIEFIDSVAGVQRSLWNSLPLPAGFVPSLACLNGAPIDITRMPGGVSCDLFNQNPAPSGGFAVRVLTCR